MIGKAVGRKYPYFTNPITWFMLLFLLINQLILSPYFPSFVSGKLSDFALVYLLPLFFIAIGSLFPFPSLQKFFPWLGFGMSLFLFGFGKIFLPVNAFIYHTLTSLLPFNTHFVFDPTDAFALVMLIPSYLVWKQTRSFEMVLSYRWKWIFIPAVMMITLADAAAPNYGITCLEYQPGGVLLAQTAYYGEPYQSSDGGLSWLPADSDYKFSGQCEINDDYSNEKMIFTSSSGLMIQFENFTLIRESLDAGKTWQTVYSIPKLSQAENAYRMRNAPSMDFIPGPFDLIEDETSGNLIAAMGLNGVLVRTTDGVWQPSAVDLYRPIAPLKENGIAGYFFLLWVEWVLCILQVFFLVSTFNLQWRRRWWRILKVVLAWLGWGLMVIMSPAISESYALGLIQILGIPVAILWAVFCLVDDINSWKKPKTKIWKRFFQFGIATAIVNAIIFSLWSVNIITTYAVASGLVIGLTLIFAIIGTIWSGALRRQEEKHG